MMNCEEGEKCLFAFLFFSFLFFSVMGASSKDEKKKE